MSDQMSSQIPASPAPRSGKADATRHTAGRRLRRAAMEAGVVLSLTFAIVAVLCMFGLQRASAFEITHGAASDGRLAVGAVLLAAFVGLCGLTTFMLRNTLQSAGQWSRIDRRQG
ncbi:hypothetical protein KHC23_09305 [Ancylobacter dichloromethanicus]|uniref:Uncharacterized protein n=1 Tax=Ancylobacter dichloromethanicus TaxID=518825 RepID=A0A9W6J737_9HYPH|nr:hypothetical protein [Ancylobacter dichloromethanicus]MBS7553848.1 hypothetical protein [Ancylobacter dichloromethanicus]GLK70953.1 hypothetical protein GCM10017643_10680 [Ancylobacter dichloromethanicus]